MKHLLADFLGIDSFSIRDYYFVFDNHDLQVEGDSMVDHVGGDVYEPKYRVKFGAYDTQDISLEELLVFIYNKK